MQQSHYRFLYSAMAFKLCYILLPRKIFLSNPYSVCNTTTNGKQKKKKQCKIMCCRFKKSWPRNCSCQTGLENLSLHVLFCGRLFYLEWHHYSSFTSNVCVISNTKCTVRRRKSFYGSPLQLLRSRNSNFLPIIPIPFLLHFPHPFLIITNIIPPLSERMQRMSAPVTFSFLVS